MVIAIAIGTVVFIVLAGLLGGAGMINAFHDSQWHPSIVTRIIDWMF